MRTSQTGSCRNIINAGRRRIEREVNRFISKTGAEDINITCFRANGGKFSCVISTTFGAFPMITGQTAGARKRMLQRIKSIAAKR